MSIRLLFVLSLLYVLFFILYLLGYVPDVYFSNDKGIVLNSTNFSQKNSQVSADTDNEKPFELTFFDVGQGDSIYIELPTNERLLIDGGGNNETDYKLSQKFVFPDCFIDYIFLTHFHLDHYGGLRKITQYCKYNNFTFNDVQCETNACNYFSRISTNNSIKKGINYTINNLYIKVLWPDEKNTNVDYSNVNNSSVVMFLDYGVFEALLTGDAESEVLDQLDLSEVFPLIDNGLDVYKVPHHGAKNALSTKLLEELKPLNCVISAGKDNKYGHPHSIVIDYLNAIKCNILRTDLSGDITFLW